MTRKAKDLNVSLAEYCRIKIDNGHITIRYVDKKYDNLLYELNMIGNNLRQMLKIFYISKNLDSSSENISKLLEEIQKIIMKVKEKIE